MDVSIQGPTLSVSVFPFDGGPEYQLNDDVLSIDTAKMIGDPAGTWQVSLTSRPDKQGRRWSELIGPQDYVEIYMSRDGAKPGRFDGTQGSQFGLGAPTQPIVMRGFVDNVKRDVMVDPSGMVHRAAIINGRDYGKVVLKRAMVFASEADPLTLVSGMLPLNIGTRLGLGAMSGYNGLMSPSEFLYRITDILLADPTVGASFRNSRVPVLHAETDIPDSHAITIFNMTPSTGSLWQFMQSWEGTPFNEMFIRDDDDFPRIHWRMAPLKDKTGVIAREGAQTPPTLDISTDDVIADQTGRSDNESLCYFYVSPQFIDSLGGETIGVLTLPTNQTVQIENILGGWNGTLPNGQPALGAQTPAILGTNPILRTDIFARYGFNALKVNYPIFPVFASMDQRDQNPDLRAATTFQIEEAKRLCAWLHRAFSANPAYDSGTLVIKGNPLVRIGDYLRIKEQDREFYVEGVTHSFTVFPTPSFITTVTVTRGVWRTAQPYDEMAWL